jgi:hypothetical protein
MLPSEKSAAKVNRYIRPRSGDKQRQTTRVRACVCVWWRVVATYTIELVNNFENMRCILFLIFTTPGQIQKLRCNSGSSNRLFVCWLVGESVVTTNDADTRHGTFQTYLKSLDRTINTRF